MNNNDLLSDLASHLSSSDSQLRKHWAQRVIDEDIPFESLLFLFHADSKTAQRFMWFVGDVCRRKPDAIEPCMPFLFSLRDQMSFPGMDRSVAVWLCETNVPQELGIEAIEQLFDWLGNKDASIASKSFSAKALFKLVKQDRASRKRLAKVLQSQTRNKNLAFGSRMKKLLKQL